MRTYELCNELECDRHLLRDTFLDEREIRCYARSHLACTDLIVEASILPEDSSQVCFPYASGALLSGVDYGELLVSLGAEHRPNNALQLYICAEEVKARQLMFHASMWPLTYIDVCCAQHANANVHQVAGQTYKA